MIEAVDRLYVEVPYFAVLQRLEGNGDARAARRHAAHEQPPTQLLGGKTEPGPARAGRAPGRNKVGEDRRQAVDRDKHVAGRLVAAASRVADNERADADELAFAIDQRCPAPGRMGWRREQRLVEQVFPAACEFALPYDIGAGPHGRAA